MHKPASIKTNLPYLIEIVPVDRGWILEMIAQAICNEAMSNPKRYKVKIVDTPSDKADLTFFLPESAFRVLKNSISVTYLAHKEDHIGAAKLFEDVARKSDYCVTSSIKYKQVLEQDGAKKVFKIPLGVNTRFFTPVLRLGVVGRTYHTGRKGERLLAEIAGMPMIELWYTGEGWPQPAGYYSTEDLLQFYRNIDYLLIPSLIEGGPVPMLEALSAGCPVIAPSDIGMVEDFPHIPFERGNAKDLKRVVEGLLQNKLLLRQSVKNCDWSVFGKRHLELFANLINQRRFAKGSKSWRHSLSHDTGSTRVLLATHGEEETAKGGPSTRVRLIASKLSSQGHVVEVRHNIQNTNDVDDFDIVHVFNSWPPQTAQQTLGLARKAGKRVIFSPIMLDLWHWPIYRQLMEYVLDFGNKDDIEIVIRQLPNFIREKKYEGNRAEIPVEGIKGHFESLRRCCALADDIIFLSRKERDLLKAIGVKTENGTLIRNGVSNNFADSVSPAIFRKAHGFDKYVLCVGRVEYRKNQALLAMAMRGIDIPLVLIGNVGDPGYLEHVRMMSDGNLYHIGRIDDLDMLASAYAGAEVFVLPSWCEGAPLVAIEAGLAGAKLVLSNMSSEPEYFGAHADYINPANVQEMHDAIVRALAKEETSIEKEKRTSFLRRRYSENEHVKNTLSLYQKSSRYKERSISESELIIDVSSLLHSLRTTGHQTGIPLAESSIIAEIMKARPSTRCIAFNDVKGRFIEIPYSELECFDSSRFNSKYWFASDAEISGGDSRLELTLKGIMHSPELDGIGSPQSMRKHLWAARAVRVLDYLGFSRRMIGCLKGIARRILTYSATSDDCCVIENASPQSKGHQDFSNIGRYINVTRVARPSLNLSPGSRILTLGQSWLSNEPLLDSLIALSSGNNLDAYVYDISYISGAHYSGWADNADRQRRVEKLLRHCTTVFTESHASEAEIAKFGRSRSLSFRTVRTQLRGKEPQQIVKPDILGRASKPFVLYVSSFNQRKNHDFLVNVWKDLIQANTGVAKRRVKLVFVGEPQGVPKYEDSGFLEELKKINIEVVHNADDNQLAGLYASCMFTVYPSIQEGWGIPVQESLVYRKICLVSNTVPAAAEIENAALIKIGPNDFFGWREALMTWTLNDKMRHEFEKQAQQYIQPTWKEITRSILESR